MTVKIHGKEYKTVAERIAEFRKEKADWLIETKIISDMNNIIVMRAAIADPEGKLLATGFAEEIRGSTNINKTSALENCETSAIGRALANLGYGGTEYASANEVSNAIIQQHVMEATGPLQAHNEAVRANLDDIYQIKVNLANGNREAAMVFWNDMDEGTKQALWMAPTKGGIFTTDERSLMLNKGN